MLKVAPEVGPGLAQSAAYENVWMVVGFFVFYAIRVWSVAGNRARGKIPLQKIPRKAKHNQRLWGRIAISPVPIRIDAADRLRQAVTETVQINRSGFPVIGRQDTEMSTVLVGQRISDLRNRLN